MLTMLMNDDLFIQRSEIHYLMLICF